jgi:hypothetical protein
MADDQDEVEALRLAYQGTFGTPSGQKVLRDIEAFTGDEHDLYNDNPLDMAYRLGARRVLLRIRAMRRKEVPS